MLQQVLEHILTAFMVFITVVLLSSAVFNNRVALIRSKRDPFFWDELTERGSPYWLMRIIIVRFLFAVTAANLLTPILTTFYVDLFGVGNGGLAEQFNGLQRTLQALWGYSILDFIVNIWPYNWLAHLLEMPVIWTLVFTGVALWVSHSIYSRWHATKYRATTEFGGAEFTEPHEARRQYQAVPDRGITFDGYGGVPLMHQFNRNPEGFKLYLASVRPKTVPTHFYKYTPQGRPKDSKRHALPGRYFIDGKAVNTIILGETRAGKGETMVLSTIDLIARGSKDQSLVIADMKGELFTKTNEHLKRHNYDVKVLNFDNLNYSMSMNLLSQALYYAKRSNWAQTRQKISQLANTIYPSDNANANEQFWISGASSTFSGLALATIWLLKREDEWQKMTVANVVNLLQQLGTTTETVTLDKRRPTLQEQFNPNVQKIAMNRLDFLVSVMDKEAQRLRDAGEQDPLLDMAIAAFNQAGMGSTETKGNIYASMFAAVELFTSDISVQKMTTIDDFRYSSVGFPRAMELQLPLYFANRKVAISFDTPDRHYDELVIADEMGLVQFAIEPKLGDYTTFNVSFDVSDNYTVDKRYANMPITDRSIVITAKKKYESQGFKRKVDPYTGLEVIKGYEMVDLDTNIEAGADEINVSFDYSEKRLAIFVVLPPLKKQYYQLALFFMEQLYQENYDWANRNKNQNINRIHFLLDEFGNFPKWPDMSTKLSAALGYNFAFTMVLQNLEQLTLIYGKEGADTLIGNSSNFLYIKSSSLPTVEEISKKLGQRTIRVTNPGHDIMTGQENVSSKERALLTPEELMKLRPGQMIAFRSAKNDDLRGAQVSTHPLYDYGWNAMPFAFNLLRGYLADSPELSRVTIQSPHRFLDLNDYHVNFSDLLDKLYAEVYGENTSPENVRTDESGLNNMYYVSRNDALLSEEEADILASDPGIEEAVRDTLLEHLNGSINTLKSNGESDKLLAAQVAYKTFQELDLTALATSSYSMSAMLAMMTEGGYNGLVYKLNDIFEEYEEVTA
ncbi:type IV secretory system conjugative DNA transfer family protein [Weissella confusa]|uniref:Type IV secretory system conjugative DNA transfer family protein n=1 Tax=Weissella fermenti TaxID=2987699 RepID=A0ABT6D679_9LACO|nr:MULTISPECIES: type IV secretory system conjugative DNA transfer family protein [Weissella]MBJ7689002.1 type IV secretory system conjugative DNA transfer family protein [Weissella confusa]MCW0928026.1 type IV secretory system conjugative DNA transfer family protein [Weissella sp. LMG 11983]MDF9300616.1 type IV secretory system conjugative DNA transfer family protein [Weissella sp. BK2]